MNINDVNIFRIIEGAADHVGSPGNLIDRVRAAEESIADLRSRDQSQMARLARIENG